MIRSLASDLERTGYDINAGMEAAQFAYHKDTSDASGHDFTDREEDEDYRHRPCKACGRTRFEVRYEGGDPSCEKAFTIEGVIHKEEQKFIRLLERAPKVMRKHGPDNPKEMTGKDLAVMQHTHGLVPETVEYAIEEMSGEPFFFSQGVHDEFQAEMDRHREASKNRSLPKGRMVK